MKEERRNGRCYPKGMVSPVLLGVSLAAVLIARWGLDLPITVGAIAMNASTIILAASAQMLR